MNVKSVAVDALMNLTDAVCKWGIAQKWASIRPFFDEMDTDNTRSVSKQEFLGIMVGVYVCVCVCVCMYVCVCVYVCMYMCVYVCVCMYVYVCMCVYIYVSAGG